MNNSNWYDRAICFGKDTNIFFPEPDDPDYRNKVRKAKAICALCPVSSECLETAIQNKEQYGIWGGMLLKERRKFASTRTVTSREINIKVVKENDSYEV